jgi:hypothetical protein
MLLDELAIPALEAVTLLVPEHVVPAPEEKEGDAARGKATVPTAVDVVP